MNLKCFADVREMIDHFKDSRMKWFPERVLIGIEDEYEHKVYLASRLYEGDQITAREARDMKADAAATAKRRCDTLIIKIKEWKDYKYNG
jgi:hypothetical protein